MSSKHDLLLHGLRHTMHDSDTKDVVQAVAGTVVGTTFAAGATTGALTVVGATGTATTLATGIGTAAGAVASVSPAIASGLVITAQVGDRNRDVYGWSLVLV